MARGRLLRGETRLSILNELKKAGRAMSVQELAKNLGLSYTSIKFSMNQLEKAGYVQRQRTPIGRGRPEVRYYLTAESAEIFPQPTCQFIEGILRTTSKLFGVTAPQKILFVWFQEMAEEGCKAIQGETIEERMRSLSRWRNSLGNYSQYEPGPPPRIIETHNPIADLFIHYPELSRIEEQMLSKVLGFPLQRLEKVVDSCKQWHFIACV